MAGNGEITEDEFGIVFGLDKFLTLVIENKLSLFSLNRNFALPLHEIIHIII